MKIKRIGSASNPLFKDLLQLLTAKGISKQKKCLISGDKIISDLLTKTSSAIDSKSTFFIFHSEEHYLFNCWPDQQCILLPKNLFGELDVIGTNCPLLCTNTPLIPTWNPAEKLVSHELLCALGDPQNLGAIVRSAQAFNIPKVILLAECANPFLPKVTKSASGCNFHIEFLKGPSIQNLDQVTDLVALDLSGPSLREWKSPEPYRWLIGEEGQGVPSKLRCKKVSIPMDKSVESLNAAVSASLLFYQITSLQSPSPKATNLKK